MVWGTYAGDFDIAQRYSFRNRPRGKAMEDVLSLSPIREQNKQTRGQGPGCCKYTSSTVENAPFSSRRIYASEKGNSMGTKAWVLG